MATPDPCLGETAVTDVAVDVEIDKNVGCAVYKWLREVCSTKLLQSPIILRGPGVVVQVDESGTNPR